MKKMKTELVSTGMKDKKKKRGCVLITAMAVLIGAALFAVLAKSMKTGEA